MPTIDEAVQSATLTPTRAPRADVTRLQIVSKRGNSQYQTNNWWEIEQVGNQLYERSGHRENCWGGVEVRVLPDAAHATRWKVARIAQMRGDLDFSAVRVVEREVPHPSADDDFAAVVAVRDVYTPSTHRVIWSDRALRSHMVAACPEDDREPVAAVLEAIASGTPPELTPVHAALLMVLLPSDGTVTWLLDQLGPAPFIDAALEAVWWTHVHHNTGAFLQRLHEAYSVRVTLWLAIRRLLTWVPASTRDEAHGYAASLRAHVSNHQRHLLALAFDEVEWAAEDMEALGGRGMLEGSHQPLLGVLRSTEDLSKCLRHPISITPSTLPGGVRWAPTTQDSIVRSVWPFVPLMTEHVGEEWVRTRLSTAHKDRARWPDDIPSPPMKKPFRPTEIDGPPRPGDLDMTARDFRNIEPYAVEQLYTAWAKQVVDGLMAHLRHQDRAKLATSLRRAYSKDSGPRDWEVGLYKWVVRARKDDLPQPTLHLLGWFGNALREIIEGLHDGDYGTDSAMGLASLAHLVPLLGDEPGTWDADRAAAVRRRLDSADRY